MHCHVFLSWHYQPVLSWYLHQPESHQLILHKISHSFTHGLTSGPKDRTPGLTGSDRNQDLGEITDRRDEMCEIYRWSGVLSDMRSSFQVNETMEELVEEISELLVPAEKYDKEDAVMEVLKTLALFPNRSLF